MPEIIKTNSDLCTSLQPSLYFYKSLNKHLLSTYFEPVTKLEENARKEKATPDLKIVASWMKR